MITSWHGNTFRITDPLWGESTDRHGFRFDRPMIVSLLLAWRSCRRNSRVPCDLRRHDLHDITLMNRSNPWSQYLQPPLRCCHSLPPGVLHVLWASQFFQAGNLLLKWCKVVCVRVQCGFIATKYMDMLSVNLVPWQCLWKGIAG